MYLYVRFGNLTIVGAIFLDYESETTTLPVSYEEDVMMIFCRECHPFVLTGDSKSTSANTKEYNIFTNIQALFTGKR